MIKAFIYDSQEEKKSAFSKYNRFETCFVVPDLNAKQSIQKLFFKQTHVLEEELILRANEFWLLLFQANFNDIHLVNTNIISSLIEEWVEEEQFELSLNSIKQFLKVFEQLLPLKLMLQSDELLSSWFQENVSSYIKWGKWYELTSQLYEKIYSLKILPHNLITTHLLLNFPDIQFDFKTQYVFDLGVELSHQEAELMVQLAQVADVHVYMPDNIYNTIESHFSNKYLIQNIGKDDLHKITSENKVSESQKIYKRFSTQLSEIKDLTFQVRQWLEQGVKPEDIAIVLPNLEEYYPILQEYFKSDGIKINKDSLITANSQREIIRWLNHLTAKTKRLQKSTVEFLEFEGQDTELSYNEFKEKLSLFFSTDDMKRISALDKKYLDQKIISQKLSCFEFIQWSFSCWRSCEQDELVLSVLNKLYVETPSSLSLAIEKWLLILESALIKKEVVVQESTGGVGLYNLYQSMWVDVSHMYVGGLNQKCLLSNNSQIISQSEVISIMNHLGVVINHETASNYAFYVNYILAKTNRQTILSYPETTFLGEIGAPEITWLAGSFEAEITAKSSAPRAANFDIQQRRISSAENVRVENDLNLSSQDSVTSDFIQQIKLSNSSMDRYNSCPFVYFMESVLKMRSLNPLDLDESPLAKGSMYHAIVEKITESSTLSFVENDLDKIIEDSKTKLKHNYLNDTHWLINKEKYLNFAKRFLEEELKYNNSYPERKVEHTELYLKYFWDQKNKELSTDRGYPIVSVIDRVDVSSDGKYVLTDYKTSKSSVRSHKSWVEHKSYQLVLYFLMYSFHLKNDNKDHKLAGLFYYILRDYKRDFGLKIEGAGDSFFEVKRKSEQMAENHFKDLVEQISDLIYETVDSIERGAFQPVPKKIETCKNCYWRKTCRAPHLI